MAIHMFLPPEKSVCRSRSNSQNQTQKNSGNCSVMPDSATLWAVACQAPLSMEFSRQDYWSRLPFPSTGIPHTSLYCTLHILHFFYKLKICGNPTSSKPIRTIFQQHFLTFCLLCPILVILKIFQTFSLLLHLLW